MRIGIDASRYAHDQATGTEWYSFNIINGLLKLFADKQQYEIELYSKKHLKFSNDCNIKNKVLPTRRFWTLWGLSREISKDPPDVLFVPSHVLPLKLPQKSVIMIHDVAFRYLRHSYSFFQYHYLNWSTKFAVKNATKIIVPSQATKDDLIRFYKCPNDKVKVIYHGFDKPKITQKEIDKVFNKSDMFKYFGIKKDLKYFLFVGRLESKKNPVRVIEAFSEFSKLNPDYILILAGKRGIGFEELLTAVKHLGLFEKVIMPGYVTEEEKAALYKYSKAFVFPSLHEGFGFPILESFHYKKPVLTSHVSCIPEVAGDGAYYVDPYDADSILNGMLKLTNDENYVKKLVKLGEKRLANFKWNHSAKETFDVLTK